MNPVAIGAPRGASATSRTLATCPPGGRGVAPPFQEDHLNETQAHPHEFFAATGTCTCGTICPEAVRHLALELASAHPLVWGHTQTGTDDTVRSS